MQKSVRLLLCMLFSVATLAVAQNRPIENEVKDLTLAIYLTILEHPFLQEMVQGTLLREKMEYYEQQDMIYLVGLRQGFLSAANLTHDPLEKSHLEQTAANLERYVDKAKHHTAAPFCEAYIDLILEVCEECNYFKFLGVVTPCMSTYHWFAHDLVDSVHENSPYKKWFEKYSSERHDQIYENHWNIVDHALNRATPEQKNDFIEGFIIGLQQELNFWQGCYEGDLDECAA